MSKSISHTRYKVLLINIFISNKIVCLKTLIGYISLVKHDLFVMILKYAIFQFEIS